MANPIRKIKTPAGTTVYQVDGRKYGARPARRQFRNIEKAEDALAEMIAGRNAVKGLRADRREITFAQQAEAYLKDSADALAGRTLRSYANALKVHILPRFGARRIVDIDGRTIKAFLTEKRAKTPTLKVTSDSRGRFKTIPAADFDPATMKKYPSAPEGERQLGIATVKHLRATMSVIFQTAVDDGLISANPVASVRTSWRGRKARMAASAAITEDKPFTEDQRDALLRWCAESDAELGDILFVLFKTGCRIGEARALRWGDVHADHIFIGRSVDDKNVVTDMTKTGPSRKVEISAGIKKVLAARFEDRKRAGHGTGAGDYIFGNGAPITVRKLARRWLRARDACGITGHVLYDTRATFASVLLSRNAPLLWVSRMLGHASPETTLHSYARWMPNESKGHIDLLDA
jgi:integrase